MWQSSLPIYTYVLLHIVGTCKYKLTKFDAFEQNREIYNSYTFCLECRNGGDNSFKLLFTIYKTQSKLVGKYDTCKKYNLMIWNLGFVSLIC